MFTGDHLFLYLHKSFVGFGQLYVTKGHLCNCIGHKFVKYIKVLDGTWIVIRIQLNKTLFL